MKIPEDRERTKKGRRLEGTQWAAVQFGLHREASSAAGGKNDNETS